VFDSDEISGLIDEFLDRGWKRSIEGDEAGLLYNGPANEYSLEWESIETVVADLSEHRNGSITFWHNGFDFTIGFSNSFSEFPNLSGITLEIDEVFFRADRYTDISNELVAVVKDVFSILESDFAFSYFPTDAEFEVEITPEQLAAGTVPDVFWLIIVSPRFVHQQGGDPLPSESVWKIEELADGSVLLIATEDPSDYTPEFKRRMRSALDIET
jgi:hypothetical protein